MDPTDARTQWGTGHHVPVVAAISCDPATFVLDARALSEGAYRPDRVLPDQFHWSAYVELAACCSR